MERQASKPAGPCTIVKTIYEAIDSCEAVSSIRPIDTQRICFIELLDPNQSPRLPVKPRLLSGTGRNRHLINGTNIGGVDTVLSGIARFLPR